jgi:DNA-directed RNA polymerase subunit alpha
MTSWYDFCGEWTPTTAVDDSLPIDSLDLSVRATNCLRSDDIKTVGDLCQRSASHLSEIRNFGRVSLDEVRNKLDAIGRTLASE